MSVREVSALIAIAIGAVLAGAAEPGQAARDSAPAQQRGQVPASATTSRTTPTDPGSKHDWKWWKDPKRIAELRLSADQVKRLDAIYQQHVSELRSFGEDYERETSDLNQLTRDRKATPENYRAQATKCAALMGRIREARTLMDYQMSLELQPEQFGKLLEIRDRERGNR